MKNEEDHLQYVRVTMFAKETLLSRDRSLSCSVPSSAAAAMAVRGLCDKPGNLGSLRNFWEGRHIIIPLSLISPHVIFKNSRNECEE
jgi:hypothetical protein